MEDVHLSKPLTSISFLRFPREIRDEVYKELLIADGFDITVNPDHWGIHPQILRTCLTIHDEAKKILHDWNHFILLKEFYPQDAPYEAKLGISRRTHNDHSVSNWPKTFLSLTLDFNERDEHREVCNPRIRLLTIAHIPRLIEAISIAAESACVGPITNGTLLHIRATNLNPRSQTNHQTFIEALSHAWRLDGVVFEGDEDCRKLLEPGLAKFEAKVLEPVQRLDYNDCQQRLQEFGDWLKTWVAELLTDTHRPRWKNVIVMIETLLRIGHFTSANFLLFHIDVIDVHGWRSPLRNVIRDSIKPQITQLIKDVVQISAKLGDIEISNQSLANYALQGPLTLFTRPNGSIITQFSREERAKIFEHFGDIDNLDDVDMCPYVGHRALHSWVEAWLCGKSDYSLRTKILSFWRTKAPDSSEEYWRRRSRYPVADKIEELLNSNQEESCARFENDAAWRKAWRKRLPGLRRHKREEGALDVPPHEIVSCVLMFRWCFREWDGVEDCEDSDGTESDYDASDRMWRDSDSDTGLERGSDSDSDGNSET